MIEYFLISLYINAYDNGITFGIIGRTGTLSIIGWYTFAFIIYWFCKIKEKILIHQIIIVRKDGI